MGEIMYKDVLITIKNDIAYITLNRPKYGNSISLSFAKELLKVAIECDQNKDIRCVVLSAKGALFSAGGDIGEMNVFKDQISIFLSELAGILHLAISRFIRMDKPLLVAIDGTAAGAGMGLALMGDLVIATPKAKFIPAYSALGLSPDAGLTWILPKLVGLRKAQQILFTNKMLNAEEACHSGLVTEIYSGDDFDSYVNEIANRLTEQPNPAISNVRRLLLESHQNNFETHLELEARAIASVSEHSSSKEGLDSYINKRTPNFKAVNVKGDEIDQGQ